MSWTSTEEHDRPAEWLLSMAGGGEYRALVEEARSVPVAAYRLARALCRVRPVPTGVPTLLEVSAAARRLADSCGLPMPSAPALIDACEEARLPVIEPLVPRRRRQAAHARGVGRRAEL